jgi:hypothetical protein
MKFELKFKENNQNLDMSFGQLQNVTDGGFERGYEQGLVDGKQVGFDNAISKLTEIEITENGRYQPENDNIGFSAVDVNIEGTEAIEQLIDESGVLEKTEGTVTEKVEQLIDKAEELDVFMHITGANNLFSYAKTFPSKAVVNLPNATTVYQAFSNWNSTTDPIPIVEELTVNAPNINVSNNQACMGQMFTSNNGVKKVILKMPDESQYMASTFSQANGLEEIVLYFSTKNIINYNQAFNSRTLKRIIGVLDFSSATDVRYMFGGNLEIVTFAPNTLSISISLSGCSKLTSDSIDSIFKGLAPLPTGVTQTLTLHKDVKILQSQVDSANAKGWTVAGGTVVSEVE